MDDSRESISIYSAVSAGIEICPAIFISDGKKRHLAYTDDYFKRHVATDTSTIVMTNNVYMTLEAW